MRSKRAEWHAAVAKQDSMHRRYCSRRSECGGSNLDYDHQQACGCQSACDGNCQAFCGYSGASGKRLLLGRGLNEVVDA